MRAIGYRIALIVWLAPALACADDWEYFIRKGDTLIGLGRRYLIDQSRWREVQSRNEIKNPYRLQPKAPLYIPVEWLKDQPAAARVEAVLGDVRLMSAQTGSEKPLVAGATLSAGDAIHTAKSGSATVSFVDGSRALILKDSNLKLEQLRSYSDTGMAATDLRLELGRLEVKVERFKGAASRYQVRTPLAQIGVRGTDFRMSQDRADAPSRAEVLEGTVNARTAVAAIDVPKGFGTVLEADKPPSPPVQLLPPPDLSPIAERIERLPIRFRWTPVPGAASYHVQLERDQRFDVVLDDALFETPEASFPDLPDGRYAMRVRGVDRNGLEGIQSEREILVKARPEPPFLETPAHESTVRGEHPQFKWAQVEAAVAYYFQLASDQDLKTKLIDAPNVNGASLQADRPLTPGEYYWRVASRRGAGDLGPFGDVQKFTLKAIPVSGDAQARIGEKTVTLQWKGGGPGQTYRLQAARDKRFDPLLVDLDLKEPKVDLPRPVGEIYLRVQAIDADGYAGPFGSPQRIDVAPAFPLIRLRVDERAAALHWPAGLTGQKLHLQLARQRNFERPLIDTLTEDTSVEIQRPAGGNFYFRMRKIDRDGYASAFTAPERVNFSDQHPALSEPQLEKGMLTFKWSSALPGQKYHFQFARDSLFTQLIRDEVLEQNEISFVPPNAGDYFVHVGLVDRDGYAASFGNTYKTEIPRNYWPLMLLLPLVLLL